MIRGLKILQSEVVARMRFVLDPKSRDKSALGLKKFATSGLMIPDLGFKIMF